ncbi:sel1 repeat family protein [Tateyamaria sp.]|nr:sel1 repeat family protein [Tateyamaria sp.]
MKRLGIISAAIISMVMLATSAFAQDFDKGVGAYDAGDYATALQEFRPLAEQGDADAQYNLGFMYSEGKGVPQDYAEAVKWYRLAAEQGHAEAQNKLGTRYDNGMGVPQDYAEAVKWYRLAAEQGNALGQNNLGFMYSEGKGVPQDIAEAVKWWRLAVEQGQAAAQYNLGVSYLKGEGSLRKDNSLAYMWFHLLLINGNELGGEPRNIAAEEMTPQAIEQAQAMARECLDSNYKNCGY